MYELYVGRGFSIKEVVVIFFLGIGEMRGLGILKIGGWRRKVGVGIRKILFGLLGIFF